MSLYLRNAVELKPEYKEDLLSLKASLGWKLLMTVVGEQRDILMHSFLRCADMNEVSIVKGKISMVDYILSVPDELLDALPEKDVDNGIDPFSSEILNQEIES